MANVETYLPLYRKYRPQSFADVMGQGAIRQTLSNALTQGKVAHAYLLCGPRGTGKTSTARIFAKSLNCEQGPTVTPCQVCASCVGITQGNALDVIEFDAASNNKVDDARELIENCQFTPMAGKYKVYIIDEVHMLTSQAFNALLKTLEEPPPNVVFIFATTEAHKVLPTIVSRCQRFDFSRITRQDIIQRLSDIAGQESITIDPEALDTIARHVRGGMRDALGLLDQVAVIGRVHPDKTISRDDVTLFIGSLEEDILVGISQAVANRQADQLLQQVGELEKRGIEPPQIVKELTTHYRHLFFVASAASRGGAPVTADQLDLPEGYFQKLQEQAPLYKLEELPQILNRLSSIERNIRHTQQPQLWLEVGLLELAHRHEINAMQDMADRLANLENALASGGTAHLQGRNNMPSAAPAAPKMQPPVQAPSRPIQNAQTSPAPSTSIPSAAPSIPVETRFTPQPTMASQPSPEQPSSVSVAAPVAQPMLQPAVNSAPAQANIPAPPAAEVSPGSAQQVYQQICQQVATSTIRELLVQQTFAISLDGANLTIGCASEPILDIVKKPQKFIHLQKAADKVLGQTANIQVVLDKNGAPPPPPPKPNGTGISQPVPQPASPVLAVQPQPLPPERSENNASTSFTEISQRAASAILSPVKPETTAYSSSVENRLQDSTTSVSFQPFDETGPEDVDEPPMWTDDPPALDPTSVAIAAASEPQGEKPSFKDLAGPISEADMEAYHLQEAKRYTLQILQGRLLE